MEKVKQVAESNKNEQLQKLLEEMESIKLQIMAIIDIPDSNAEDELIVPTPIVEVTTKAGKAFANGISQRKLDDRISNILFSIGISAHIKGFPYIKESVKICVGDQKIVNNITNKLYPMIAERHQTSASKVERAIRHAIQVAMDRGRLSKINEIFGVHAVQKDKPTNGEFISLLTERLIIELMED